MTIITNTDFVDRISQLPDDILEIILCFLEVRQAVRTGILSKRWKNLWVSMAKVKFEFGLRDERPEAFKFPDWLLTSTTLKELTILYPLNALRFPRPFVLPNLKVLHLHGCRCYNYDEDDEEEIEYDPYSPFLPDEPFSGFSNLEKLTLNCCSDVSIISAPKLRFLELAHPNHGRYQPELEEISAHQLTSFRYQGVCTLECKRLDCPRLEELCIDMWARWGGDEKIDRPLAQKKLAPKLVEMLQRFGNHAKVVTFSLETIEILAADNWLLERSPSPFPNLKHLKFQRNSSRGCERMKVVPALVMKYLTKGCSHDVSSSYLPDR